MYTSTAKGGSWGGGVGGFVHEELFQVYYSNCILPLPEDLALKQDNNKGFAVFQHKVHVPEAAPAPASQHNSRDVPTTIIITGKPPVYAKTYLSIFSDRFHHNKQERLWA